MLYSSCSLTTNRKRQSAVASFCRWEKNKTSNQSVSVSSVFLSVLSTRSPKDLAYQFLMKSLVFCFHVLFFCYCLKRERRSSSGLSETSSSFVPCDEHGRKQNVSAKKKKASKRHKTLKKKGLKEEVLVFVQILFFIQKILTLNKVDKE